MIKFLMTVLFVLSIAACGKPIVDHTQAQEISVKQQIHQQLIKVHKPVGDYTLARRYLFGQLHYNNGVVTDVYCDENYDAVHGVGYNRIPNPEFLNCEHTWPQSKFKGQPEEATMKVDLHHLYPAKPMANSARSNHPFGEVTNYYNVCGTSYKGTIIGRNITGFEPPEHHKGNVARALFYFSARYNMAIDPVQESFLRQWHVQDPVDIFELKRNKRIMEIQGNSNVFITNPSMVDRIEDF